MNGPLPHRTSRSLRTDLPAELARDADEARARAPLVEAADPLPARWRRLLRRALPLLVLAALAVVLVASGLSEALGWDRLVAQHARLLAWKDAHPLWAALGLLGAMVLLMASGLPGSLGLAMFAGVLYGTLVGALLASLGSTTGAALLYAASRHFFLDLRANPALLEWLRAGYQRHPVSFTFFIRLFPAFPMGPLSAALAWLGCPWWLFVCATASAAFVQGLVWCGLGAGLAHALHAAPAPGAELIADPHLLLPLAGLAALALLPALFPGLRGARRG